MNGIGLALPCGVIAYGSTGWHSHTRTGMFLMNDTQFSKIPCNAGEGSPSCDFNYMVSESLVSAPEATGHRPF